MTKSEYQELVEFIAPRFDRIDKRFDSIDERFAAVDNRFDAIDERLRRVEILGEENRHQIQIVSGSRVRNRVRQQVRGVPLRGGRWLPGPSRAATGSPGAGPAGDAPGERIEFLTPQQAFVPAHSVVCLSHADSCLDSTNTPGASCT